MKILFAGDSITNGKLGASFVDIIQLNSNWQIQNIGTNGWPLQSILKNLFQHLQKKHDYDIIVIQGGYNDILLPLFKSRKGWFHWAYKQQIKKGHIPIDIEDLHRTYTLYLKNIKSIFKGEIILINIGCVSELVSSELNQIKRKFNQQLKQIAEDHELKWVDISTPFENFLSHQNCSDACLTNFWSVVLLDPISKNWLKISAKRNLHLTIDGVHLNPEGAKIVANELLKIITTNYANDHSNHHRTM